MREAVGTRVREERRAYLGIDEIALAAYGEERTGYQAGCPLPVDAKARECLGNVGHAGRRSRSLMTKGRGEGEGKGLEYMRLPWTCRQISKVGKQSRLGLCPGVV